MIKILITIVWLFALTAMINPLATLPCCQMPRWPRATARTFTRHYVYHQLTKCIIRITYYVLSILFIIFVMTFEIDCTDAIDDFVSCRGDKTQFYEQRGKKHQISQQIFFYKHTNPETRILQYFAKMS